MFILGLLQCLLINHEHLATGRVEEILSGRTLHIVQGNAASDIPLSVSARRDDLVVYSYADREAVHVLVPVDGQASFRDARGAGESVCGHAHVVLPIRPGSFGSSALVMTVRRGELLTVSASLSRLTRDPQPRLSISISARPAILPKE